MREFYLFVCREQILVVVVTVLWSNPRSIPMYLHSVPFHQNVTKTSAPVQVYFREDVPLRLHVGHYNKQSVIILMNVCCLPSKVCFSLPQAIWGHLYHFRNRFISIKYVSYDFE